ncbi:MAG: ABC transporter ATP-binding protein [Clostridia bacterium]|nr:ABC transporter ATP-binding protein [Clostridia bacterium]
MIEIADLKKSYEKGKDVLCGVCAQISDGSVFGLVGINGAGKSTLLRLIAGVLKQDRGQVCVDGEPIWENEEKKREIFFLPDDPFYTANVTAAGLAEMYASVYDMDKRVFLTYLEKFKLNEKTPIRNFSKGMKRQVFVSLALAIAPKYLLLDEAFDGLDPLARLVFKRGLVSLVEEKGTTVIISSHSLRELEDICDSYGILDHGQITCSGELVKDLEKLHKFQMAFDREISKEEFGFECMSFTKTGRVVQIIAKGDAEAIATKIEALQPLFVEEIEVDFEELFIGEVEARGYLQ